MEIHFRYTVPVEVLSRRIKGVPSSSKEEAPPITDLLNLSP